MLNEPNARLTYFGLLIPDLQQTEITQIRVHSKWTDTLETLENMVICCLFKKNSPVRIKNKLRGLIPLLWPRRGLSYLINETASLVLSTVKTRHFGSSTDFRSNNTLSAYCLLCCVSAAFLCNDKAPSCSALRNSHGTQLPAKPEFVPVYISACVRIKQKAKNTFSLVRFRGVGRCSVELSRILVLLFLVLAPYVS